MKLYIFLAKTDVISSSLNPSIPVSYRYRTKKVIFVEHSHFLGAMYFWGIPQDLIKS